MTCPVCGKASPCVHERGSVSAFSDHNTFPDDQALAAAAAIMASDEVASDSEAEAGTAWRQEIASRVEQHRARRRRPADPQAMELDFSSDTPHSFGALARDGALPPPPPRFTQILLDPKRVQEELARREPRIIRFPRTQPAYIPTVEEVTLEELELAEPLPEAPRILDAGEAETFASAIVEDEVFEEQPDAEAFQSPVLDHSPYAPDTFVSGIFEPEPKKSYPVKMAALEGKQMDFLASFADIRLEAEETRNDDIPEIIPRPAPLAQRFISCLVDAGIVFTATGVFALTVVIAADEMPQSRLTLPLMLASGGIFWMIFQYIFLTFRRNTPGMKMAQLELCTFAGATASPHSKQLRALASALSTFSMGLGYAWALVDEDRVGWHDRISQTHMRQAISTQPSAFSAESYSGWRHFLKSRSAARDPYEFDDLKG